MTEQELKAIELIQMYVDLMYEPSANRGSWHDKYEAGAEIFKILTGKTLIIHDKKVIIKEDE